MAFPIAPALVAGLMLVAGTAALSAQTATPQAAPAPQASATPAAADPLDTSLSPECRVPGSKLYTLAPLRSVKTALKTERAVRVLAIGSSSTVGVGASSALASYPVRLEGELTKLFPNVAIEVVNRGISGEVAEGAAHRMRNTIAEVEPDLVVWQVGTNDVLARVDVAAFARMVDDTLAWLKEHKIDVVLVDPQYTRKLASDAHCGEVVQAIETAARRERVPLVRRFEAMRYLADRQQSRSYLSTDQFHLNDLGYRCMAEHIARTIAIGLVQADRPSTVADAPAATLR